MNGISTAILRILGFCLLAGSLGGCATFGGMTTTPTPNTVIGSLPLGGNISSLAMIPTSLDQSGANLYAADCPYKLTIDVHSHAFSSILNGEKYIVMPPDDGSSWWKFQLAHECAHLKLNHPVLREAGLVTTSQGFHQQEVDADRMACDYLKNHGQVTVVQDTIRWFYNHYQLTDDSHPNSLVRIYDLKKCLAG